eukprot:4711693-Pleurochrysis_carterae.AAC.1
MTYSMVYNIHIESYGTLVVVRNEIKYWSRYCLRAEHLPDEKPQLVVLGLAQHDSSTDLWHALLPSRCSLCYKYAYFSQLFKRYAY